MRSRKILFAVDPRTRPMKDRTREAVMNLLGGTFDGSIAFDLFGGTGILAFESISRGASSAVVFEILRNATREIESNASLLGISDRVRVISTDVLSWSESLDENLAELRSAGLNSLSNDPLASPSWLVYCCPPYALWKSDEARLRDMLTAWINRAPIGSLFAIELEESTPSDVLPNLCEWDVRIYRPAKMVIGEKQSS